MAPLTPLANPGNIEKAIAAVANAYEGLLRENGYRYDVVHVYRHSISEDSLDSVETPAVVVVRPDGQTGTIQWQDERAYLETLRLDVVGLLRASGENPEEEGFSTKAEAFLSDIKKLAMADPQFGLGHAGVIKNSRIVADANDAAWDSAIASAGMGLEITVFFDGTNP